MQMHINTLDGDLPPFCWIQSRVRVMTLNGAEEIEGTLMGIFAGDRISPCAFLIHDQYLDVPIWIPSVSSIHPLTDHIIELDRLAAQEEEDQVDYEDESTEEIDDDDYENEDEEDLDAAPTLVFDLEYKED